MSITHPLVLGGSYGSPYSLKMRAVLRYRRIPFTWVLRDSALDRLPPVPVRLIPVIGFPDDSGEIVEAAIDSSPLIMRLEGMHEGRSLVPTDPVVAFLDYLVEDYGDEWCTKAMYHYRWFYPEDTAKAAALLPLDSDLHHPAERYAMARDFITKRQQGRMALVGSTEQNRPVIEASYVRLLELLDGHLQTSPFLFGTRPGRGDFGIFGQLSQLVGFDPVPARLALEHAPRVCNWVERIDDLSWWPTDDDGGWVTRDGLAPAVRELLAEIGRTYAPFMVANHAAMTSGLDEVVVEIDGHEYRQGPFPYQVKCLQWLREQRAALTTTDREAVDALLDGTGCEVLFA